MEKVVGIGSNILTATVDNAFPLVQVLKTLLRHVTHQSFIHLALQLQQTVPSLAQISLPGGALHVLAHPTQMLQRRYVPPLLHVQESSPQIGTPCRVDAIPIDQISVTVCPVRVIEHRRG